MIGEPKVLRPDNPVITLAAHTGYEAMRALSDFMPRRSGVKHLEGWDSLGKDDRNEYLDMAWSVIRGAEPAAVYSSFAQPVAWREASIEVRMVYTVFVRTAQLQVGVTMALAEGQA